MYKYKTPVRQLAHRWLQFHPERIQFLENIVSNLSDKCREEVYHALASYDIWGGYPDACDYTPFAVAIATDLINYFNYCSGRLHASYSAAKAIGSPVFLTALQIGDLDFYCEVACDGASPYDYNIVRRKRQIPDMPKLPKPQPEKKPSVCKRKCLNAQKSK